MPVTRRDFIGAGVTAAAAGLTLPGLAAAATHGEVMDRSRPASGPRSFSAPPVIIGSENGFVSKNASGKTGIEVAYDILNRGGDPLDAVIAGVNVVERDPNDQSVGIGGLPNEEGVVQLD